MPNLSFAIDWVDAEGIEGAELAATWASLRIQSGSSVVTQVHDMRAQTVRDFVFVPVYPLAEWLATNWWFLTRECENPVKAADPAFRRRHGLGSNREGYAFPNLEVVSLGTQIRLSWSRTQPYCSKVEFLNQGAVQLDIQEFRERCAELIDCVIQRLHTLNVHDTLLQDEWTAIQATDADESQFCAAAAGLGLDPYDMNESERTNLLRLANQLGDSVLEEAVAALDPQCVHEGGACIANAMQTAKSNGLRLANMESLRQSINAGGPSSTRPAWKSGYQLARQLRQVLDLGAHPLKTMEKYLAEKLGGPPDLMERMAQPVDLTGALLVDGVVVQEDDEPPAFALRPLRKDNQWFHFCRALSEMLASPNTDGLLTRAHTERQQRNRAFAAEFLAPSSALQEKISGLVVDGEDIDELAAQFGVSTRVIEQQIVNHRIAVVQ